MARREQAEKQCADAALSHTEGDGLRLHGEEPDQPRGGEIEQQPREFRDEHAAHDPEGRTALGPPVVPGAEILSHKGRQREREARDGQKGEAFQLPVGAAAGHGHSAEDIDVRLYDDVGQPDHGILHARREPVAKHPAEHPGLKTQFTQPDAVFRIRHGEAAQAEQPAEKLGNNGRERGAPDTGMEDGNEDDVEHHVQRGGKNQIVKRMTAVAHGLHHAAQGIVEHESETAREEDTCIGDGERHHVLGRIHPAEDRRGHRDADKRHQQTGEETEGEIRADRGLQLFRVFRAVIARDQNAGAGGDAHKKADEQIVEIPRGADGGQRVVAEHAPDDQRVGGVIELLKEIADEEGHRKSDQVPRDAALGHAGIGRVHGNVSPLFCR